MKPVYLPVALLLFGATVAIAARPVKFASGRATVTFPDNFKVASEGEDLVARFGEDGDHKVDFRLLKATEPGMPADLAVGFVDRYAKEHSLKVTHFDNRAYLSEPGPQVSQDGREFQITYWLIAADNCMFGMAITAPLPKSKELDAFLGDPLSTLIQEVSCSP